MNFLALLTRIFLVVAGVSWEASVLVLLVLATRLLAGRRLPLRWRQALWIFVLARLLLPVLPASPFSIDRIANPVLRVGALEAPASLSIGGFPTDTDIAGQPASKNASASGWIVKGVRMAAVVWVLGMIALAAAIAWSNVRFVAALRRDQRRPTDDVLRLARACADELGVHRAFRVLETGLVGSPAIFGLWRAQLLLPSGLANGFGPDKLRLVLLHELAHLRRADLAHHALVSFLQVVHWFNPLLWLAFARMREDRELATDALVLSGRRAELKVQYGRTLLELIEKAQGHSTPPQLVGILENPGQLKDRLLHIRQATSATRRWSTRGLALLCVLGALFLTRAYREAKTLVIQSRISNETWNGWGFASPNDTSPAAEQPEQFSLIQNSPTPRTFSGRVAVDGPLDGVEVGLVSLVGVHWVNPHAYQWQAVKPDGTFSLTDDRYQDASKALVVRGPHTPWTFLRYNFASNESATGIVLRPPPTRAIELSVSGEDGRDLAHSSFEFFPAHAQFDDHGHVLRRQRLGEYKSGTATQVEVAAPAGEIAVFAHCDGHASYYQAIDTRQADHFRFVLQAAGRMKIRVLDVAGKPQPNVRVNWINPAAPLSISGTSTDSNGTIVQGNLTPGTFEVSVDGLSQQEVKVEGNRQADVVFRAKNGP